jgi:chromatin segregation and condensation protein Rec8/ScpA/Scc1 (kleisin family)
MRRMPSLEIEVPRKKIDVSALMGHLYDKILHTFNAKKEKVYFTDLIPSSSKEDKVITFIPLLHLTNQRRVDLEQASHLGPIEILMNQNAELEKEIDKELA